MHVLLLVIVKPLQMRSRDHFSLILVLISLSAAEQSCKKQNRTFPWQFQVLSQRFADRL